MLSPKTKGYFFEINEFSFLAAVTSGLDAPLTIESLHEFPGGEEPEKIKGFVEGLRDKKARPYLTSRCSIYPKSRFIRRATLDSPAKVKDPSFFQNLLSSQFRISPESNSVAVLNALDGSEFDLGKGFQSQKEVILCGAGTEELERLQETVVEYGIYPDTLELGSLVSLGGLMHYSQFKKTRLPTLVLEITPSNSNVFIFSNTQIDVCRPIPYGLTSMFPTVQSELGLKDEDSARKLFYSNTFDFSEMGPALLRKMLKELQASTGFYEVQTGQTIGQIFLTLLPLNFRWIHKTLSKSLGVDVLNLDYPGWLKSLNISIGNGVQLESLDNRWVGLFSLMGKFAREEGDGAAKT